MTFFKGTYPNLLQNISLSLDLAICDLISSFPSSRSALFLVLPPLLLSFSPLRISPPVAFFGWLSPLVLSPSSFPLLSYSCASVSTDFLSLLISMTKNTTVKDMTIRPLLPSPPLPVLFSLLILLSLPLFLSFFLSRHPFLPLHILSV